MHWTMKRFPSKVRGSSGAKPHGCRVLQSAGLRATLFVQHGGSHIRNQMRPARQAQHSQA
eukprot:6088688-Lingulodinium_polyedra.AAC.1